MSLRKHLLTEAVQRGILYHFTPVYRAQHIFSDDVLSVSDGSSHISLTRNYSLGMKFGNVRIAIDGDKLSNNYKIEPYLDPEYNAFDKSYDYYDDDRREEREEKVERDITNLKRYVIQVDIMIDMEVDKHTIQMERVLENLGGINYDFVKEWKPVKK